MFIGICIVLYIDFLSEPFESSSDYLSGPSESPSDYLSESSDSSGLSEDEERIVNMML